MVICKRVHYTGAVQGVGFRYTAHELATGFAVSGFVRNLPEGRVELVAEGEPDQVNAFLAAVRRRMAGYIEEEAATDEVPSGAAGFRIRH